MIQANLTSHAQALMGSAANTQSSRHDITMAAAVPCYTHLPGLSLNALMGSATNVQVLITRVGRISKSARLLFWVISESEGLELEFGPRIFESWSSQTNDFRSDTCRFLAWRSPLLG